jgi:hypothetical protein
MFIKRLLNEMIMVKDTTPMFLSASTKMSLSLLFIGYEGSKCTVLQMCEVLSCQFVLIDISLDSKDFLKLKLLDDLMAVLTSSDADILHCLHFFVGEIE